VLLFQGGALDPLAASPLALERVDRLALHVAGATDRDDDVLFGDQILDVELALVGLELGPTSIPVLPLDLGQLLLDHAPELLGALEQRVQLLEPAEQVLVLLLQLGAREPGEPPERHVQDVIRLDLAQLELLHQLGAGFLGVLRSPDGLDHLVEVIEGDQQALDDVVALLGLPLLVAGPARDDIDLMVDVVPDHLGEVERARHTVDEREHDHAEVVLQLRVLVELVQHDVRVRGALQVDHESHALATAGVVLDVGDVLDASRLHELRDLLREPGLVHLVRQLTDHDAGSAGAPLLDGAHTPNLDGSPARLVGIADAVLAE